MTAKVFDMLLAVPKYGRVKTNRILNQCRISPSKTIGGLSERQRAELVSRCAASTDRPRRSVSRGRMSKVFVITGPSGVGKGTLIKRLLSACPTSSSRSRRRPGAARGRGGRPRLPLPHREEFERRIAREDFLEFATYSGNRYGTLRSEVERRLDGGPLGGARDRGPGAQQVRAAMPDSVQIFIAPPDPRCCASGSSGRGTDSAEAIDARLEVAEQ